MVQVNFINIVKLQLKLILFCYIKTFIYFIRKVLQHEIIFLEITAPENQRVKSYFPLIKFRVFPHKMPYCASLTCTLYDRLPHAWHNLMPNLWFQMETLRYGNIKIWNIVIFIHYSCFYGIHIKNSLSNYDSTLIFIWYNWLM